MAMNRFIRITGVVGLLSGTWFGALQPITEADAQVQGTKLTLTVAPAAGSQTTIQNTGYIPKALKSSQFPSRERTRNVFGRDDRIPMTSSDYPWSTIGRVEAPLKNRRMAICTGTLIAKDLVLTNAHCVFDQTGHPHASMSFSPNLINNQAIAKASVVSAVVGTTQPESNRNQDWAILKLNAPLGEQYGWMEWVTASVATLKQYQKQFMLAGYSVDFPRYRGASTAGVHIGCSIRGVDSMVGLATHDCDMTRGASGGTIFYISKQGMGKIVALNAAEGITPQGEHPSRFNYQTANSAVLTGQWATAAQSLRARSR